MTLDIDRDLREIFTKPCQTNHDVIDGIAMALRAHFRRAVFFGPNIVIGKTMSGDDLLIPAFECGALVTDRRAQYASFIVHNAPLVSDPNAQMRVLTLTVRDPGAKHFSPPLTELWFGRGMPRMVLDPGWVPSRVTTNPAVATNAWEIQRPGAAEALVKLARRWMAETAAATAVQPVRPRLDL